MGGINRDRRNFSELRGLRVGSKDTGIYRITLRDTYDRTGVHGYLDVRETSKVHVWAVTEDVEDRTLGFIRSQGIDSRLSPFRSGLGVHWVSFQSYNVC